MGKKKDPMSAKALSQRLKWRGLQKLKYYCQLCERQMRDDNGMKCHMMSEQHQRNMMIMAESPEKYIEEYSELFHRDYIALLKRRWGTTRVHCNVVYCEYVAHKTHYHMNATRWTTLTQYVQWLGDQGICKVDFQDDPVVARHGWYVQYIDRDPEVERRKKEIERLAKKQLDMDERHNSKIEEMVKRDQEKLEENDVLDAMRPDDKEVDLSDSRKKISVALPGARKMAEKYQENILKSGQEGFKSIVAQSMYKKPTDENKPSLWSKSSSSSKNKPTSALESIMVENERQKEVTQKLKEEKEQKMSEREREIEEQLQREEEISKQMALEYGDFNAWADDNTAEFNRHADRTRAKYYELSKTLIPGGDKIREAYFDGIANHFKSGGKDKMMSFKATVRKFEEEKSKKRLGPNLQTVSGEGLEIKKARYGSGASGVSGKSSELLEETIEDEEDDSQPEDPSEIPWLLPNISVKVITKDLGDKFYKKKGKVIKIVKDNQFEGMVQMYKTNVTVKLDQTHVETIIPAIGRDVLILCGKYRGRKGKINRINSEIGSVAVDLYETRSNKARLLGNVKYHECSKLVE